MSEQKKREAISAVFDRLNALSTEQIQEKLLKASRSDLAALFLTKGSANALEATEAFSPASEGLRYFIHFSDEPKSWTAIHINYTANVSYTVVCPIELKKADKSLSQSSATEHAEISWVA